MEADRQPAPFAELSVAGMAIMLGGSVLWAADLAEVSHALISQSAIEKGLGVTIVGVTVMTVGVTLHHRNQG